MTADASVDTAFFDRLYAGNADPWGFSTSGYERGKYIVSLAALPGRHYRAALEVGCSIGVFTRQLAGICDDLLATDVAAAALEQARLRCADLPHVRVRQARIPAEWPAGRFDLITCSEVLYFLGADDLAATAARLCDSLTQDGVVLLVNWLGDTGTAFGGDAAADRLIACARAQLTRRLHLRMPRYRVDVLTR